MADNSASPTSNAHSQSATQEDEQLSELLDSALQDFKSPALTGESHSGKPSSDDQAASSADVSGSRGSAGILPADFGDLEGVPPFLADPSLAQKAATDFHNMIQQLAELQKTVIEKNLHDVAQDRTSSVGNPESDVVVGDGAAGAAIGTEGSAEGLQDNDHLAAAMIENLTSLSTKAQKIGQAQSEDEFKAALEELHKDDTFENEFMPFMGGLMGTLLSKEMLYPSLTEIGAKYPEWIDQNKDKISKEDLERYNKQLEVIQKICTEYSEEKDDDSDDVAGARFHRIMVLLQHMQMLGQPPLELVGDMPSGWSMDPQSGMPKITDQDAAAESCSVM